MPLVYRTTGAWGAGVGRALTPQEIDGNFRYIQSRLATVGANQPIGIDTIESADNEIATVLMEDLTEHTFTLPTYPYRYVGEWVDSAAYLKYDTFSVNGAMYVVTVDHTTDLTFSVDAINSSGNGLYRLLSGDELTLQSVIHNDDYTPRGDTDFTPTIDDANKYIQFGFYYTGIPSFTIPAESSVDFPIGTRFDILQWGINDVDILFPSGVIVNAKTDCNFMSDGSGSFIVLIKVGADEWDLTGDTGTTA